MYRISKVMKKMMKKNKLFHTALKGDSKNFTLICKGGLKIISTTKVEVFRIYLFKIWFLS